MTSNFLYATNIGYRRTLETPGMHTGMPRQRPTPAVMLSPSGMPQRRVRPPSAGTQASKHDWRGIRDLQMSLFLAKFSEAAAQQLPAIPPAVALGFGSDIDWYWLVTYWWLKTLTPIEHESLEDLPIRNLTGVQTTTHLMLEVIWSNNFLNECVLGVAVLPYTSCIMNVLMIENDGHNDLSSGGCFD